MTLLVVVVLAIVVVDVVLRMILRRERAPRKDSPAQSIVFRALRIAVNVFGAVALFLAAYTSLFHDGPALTGDSLIRHVTVAPAFALAAVVVALFWAHRNRFSGEDWGRGWATPLRKVFFWISVALAIPTMVSILAAMFPIFGTDDQQTLVEIHRYCAEFLAGSGFLFAYFALVTWWERSQD